MYWSSEIVLRNELLAGCGAAVRKLMSEGWPPSTFGCDTPLITAAREANNDYVWTAHERLARQQGVTNPIINTIRNRTAPDGLSGDDAKVVRFAKELLTTHEIADATFNAMHQMLGNKGIMDLILLILYYHSLAHALQAVKLEMPPGTPSTL